MGTIVSGAVMALLGELEKATSEIIERHMTADEAKPETEQTLRYHDFFGVAVESIDGVLAKFWDEGIELYPDLVIVKKVS